MEKRKLASVQYVHPITPIEGALSMKVLNNDYLLKE